MPILTLFPLSLRGIVLHIRQSKKEMNLHEFLSGGDLRSISGANEIARKTNDQSSFDELFACLFTQDRLVAMRAADAVEKITAVRPAFLLQHKAAVLALCRQVQNKELQWHLALLLPRLQLNEEELGLAWDLLTRWAMDKKASRIVRVNAIQALFELLQKESELAHDFEITLAALEGENIPSLSARIRKLRRQVGKKVKEPMVAPGNKKALKKK